MNATERPTIAIVSSALAAVAATGLFSGCREGGAAAGGGPALHVAVAANFSDPMQDLAQRFHAADKGKVSLSFGSTGKLYAQIKNGAPFALFFSADAERPQLLEQEGLAVPGCRFTYAIGKLVLWSPRPGYVDAEGDVLGRGDFRYLAMANADLAPYGRAAQQVLVARGLDAGLRNRIVRGEDISQTLQFVRSGNADLGFVAWSQVMRPGRPVEGSYWEVPQALYTPIEQQVVLLKEGETARAFLDFVRSSEAADLIRGYGYGTPP